MLAALTRALDWVWITGNHDPAMRAQGGWGGELAQELELGGVILRHRAVEGEMRPEMSGHYHPRLQVTLRARRIRRPCAVIGQPGAGANAGERMILPAFGAFTGGMDAGDPAIVSALQPAARICALVPTRHKIASFPLWQAAA
jgi:metallophosphoesterase superfamily enzyme